MQHDFQTEKGDSGTPFLIQPFMDKGVNNKQCFIVGIHVSVKAGRVRGEKMKKGVVMTDNIVRQLGQLSGFTQITDLIS